MVASDWDILIKAVATLLTTVVVPWGILAYQRRTGVQVTDQERASVYAALTTAAGILQTQLDQGLIQISDINANNKSVMVEARAALARVPDSAAAQGVSPAAAAAIVVGRVDTSSKGPIR